MKIRRVLLALAPIVVIYLIVVAFVVYRIDYAPYVEDQKKPAIVPAVQQRIDAAPQSLLDAQIRSNETGSNTTSKTAPIGVNAQNPSPAPSTTTGIKTTPAVSIPTTAPATASSPIDDGKNPGVSINPVDKDKTLETDAFKYTLIDVRKDAYEYQGQNSSQNVNVYIYKFYIESKMSKDYAFSGSEFAFRDGTPQKTSSSSSFGFDFTYPADRIGKNLASNEVIIKPGEKIIGYYVETLNVEAVEPTNFYVALFNIGYDAKTGKLEDKNAFIENGAFIIK